MFLLHINMCSSLKRNAYIKNTISVTLFSNPHNYLVIYYSIPPFWIIYKIKWKLKKVLVFFFLNYINRFITPFVIFIFGMPDLLFMGLFVSLEFFIYHFSFWEFIFFWGFKVLNWLNETIFFGKEKKKGSLILFRIFQVVNRVFEEINFP